MTRTTWNQTHGPSIAAATTDGRIVVIAETSHTSIALPETQRSRRGHGFYPDTAMPALYDTEDTPAADKTIHAHYFAGGSDWWIAELDPTTGLAYGYARIGGMDDCAEWGYVDLTELETINVRGGLIVVERDLHWTPVPFSTLPIAGARA